MRFVCVVLLLAATGPGQGALLDTPVDHVLAGVSTQVPILATVPLFNASRDYFLEAAAGNASACAVTSPSQLSCGLALPEPGDAAAQLLERGQADNDVFTTLYSMVFRAYLQPTVRSISPTALSRSGGTKFELSLDGVAGFGAGVPRFSDVRVRFLGASGSLECSVTFLDATFGQVVGRAPFFRAYAAGAVLSVLLAMDGRTFVSTGLTVTLVDRPKLKVGFIFIGHPEEDQWTFQHNVARLALERRFYGQIEILTQSHVAEFGPNECDFCASMPTWNANTSNWIDEPADFRGTHRSANIISKWVEEDGVELVFATSFWFHWDAYHMAARYPSAKFVHVTGWLTRHNMAQVFARVYQSRYLSGIVLGWYLKLNNLPKKAGFISSFRLGETIRHINAFKLGLEQVDPDIDLYVSWVASWHDDRKEQIATKRLIRYYGVQGVAQHTDSRAPQEAARDEGRVGVGYNTDMMYVVGDSVLTSPVLVWGDMYGSIVQKVLDGDDGIENDYWEGFETASTRLSALSPLVPAEAAIQVAAEQAKFEQGEDSVFCKPNMRDNKGRLRNGPTNPAVNPVPWEVQHLRPGSSCLTDAVVRQSCQEYVDGNCAEHWLLEGVHESCAPSPRMPGGIQAATLPAGACFLGDLDLPEKCPDGEFLQVAGCTKARRGFFAEAELELPCPVGRHAPVEGLAACLPCAEGHISGATGAALCEACPAGRVQSEAGQSACGPCEPGRFTAENGSLVCAMCPVGSYQDLDGSTGCRSCPGVTTTRYRASASIGSCVCPEGTFRPRGAATGACEPCPAGLRCAVGSDEACFGGGEGACPQAMEGYMTLAQRPLKVYRCLAKDHCPGGMPGSCANHRDSSKIACGGCAESAYEDTGDSSCKPCDGVSVVPFVVLPLLLLAGGMTAGALASTKPLKQSQKSLTCMLIGSTLITSMQSLGIFADLAFTWPQPMRNVLASLRILSFDLRVLRLSCFLRTGVVARYVARQTMPLLAAPLVVLGVLLKQRLAARELRIRIESVNAIGNIFNILFISILVSCISPLICFRHPDDRSASLREDPATLCWSSAEHRSLVAVCILAVLVIVAPFTSFVVFVTWRHAKAAQGAEMPWSMLASRFLFLKFTPQRYYYGTCLLARSFFIALVPIVLQKPALQIIALCSILLIVNIIVNRWLPWRAAAANAADTALTSALLLTLLAGSLGADLEVDTIGYALLGWIAAIGFLAVFATVVVLGLVMIIYRRGPRYDHFICHRRENAAAQARFLKMRLTRDKQEVFVDSDNLLDLDGLFNIVKAEVRQLVVLLTLDALRRPWCAGEVTTATLASKAKVVAVRTRSFVQPTEAQLLRLDLYLDDEPGRCVLAQYHIAPADVQDAYRRLLGPETHCIELGLERGTQKYERVLQELQPAWRVLPASPTRTMSRAASSSSALGDRPERRQPGAVLLSADAHDDEAVAVGGILRLLLKDLLAHEAASAVQLLCDWDAAASVEELALLLQQARAVILLLTAGTLLSQEQLLPLLAAAACRQLGKGSELMNLSQPTSLVPSLGLGRRPLEVEPLAIISVALPSFTFPQEPFYTEIFPRAFPQLPPQAAALLQSFFKLIATPLSIGASQLVLQAQAAGIAGRVPEAAPKRRPPLPGELLQLLELLPLAQGAPVENSLEDFRITGIHDAQGTHL